MNPAGARDRAFPMIGRLVAVGVLATSGCASNSSDTAETLTPIAASDCQPPDASRLAEDFSAVSLAGSWSVWMFADEGESAGSAAGGRLELVEFPAGEEPLVGGSPAALHGSADIDLVSVGAADTGDAAVRSVERPGVLVLQWREVDADRPSVTLRLGDRTNRLDRMTFDDAFTALHVAETADTAFAGRWRSGTGRGPVAAGRFCAIRA